MISSESWKHSKHRNASSFYEAITYVAAISAKSSNVTWVNLNELLCTSTSHLSIHHVHTICNNIVCSMYAREYTASVIVNRQLGITGDIFKCHKIK